MLAAIVSGTRSTRTRLLGLLIASLLLAYQPAFARIDWCSADPLYTFYHQDHGSLRTVDVQVLVPLTALPLTKATTLTAKLPRNVQGEVILNTSTPLFVLNTTVESTLPSDSSAAYPATFVVNVPSSGRTFPVRLLVTNPLDGQILTFDGWSGQELRATIEVAP